jgi:hypothetical protein
MLVAMVSNALHDLQVRWPIVRFVPVDVMYDLSASESSAKCLFGDEPMFVDVAADVGYGMVWHFH